MWPALGALHLVRLGQASASRFQPLIVVPSVPRSAPTFIHLATDDVVKSEAIDGEQDAPQRGLFDPRSCSDSRAFSPLRNTADSYVALLTQGAALGSAFGKCDGHTQDAIDWSYSAAKVPAGKNPLALVSGNDHNNTLIKAYFSDNPGKVVSSRAPKRERSAAGNEADAEYSS